MANELTGQILKSIIEELPFLDDPDQIAYEERMKSAYSKAANIQEQVSILQSCICECSFTLPEPNLRHDTGHLSFCQNLRSFKLTAAHLSIKNPHPLDFVHKEIHISIDDNEWVAHNALNMNHPNFEYHFNTIEKKSKNNLYDYVIFNALDGTGHRVFFTELTINDNFLGLISITRVEKIRNHEGQYYCVKFEKASSAKQLMQKVHRIQQVLLFCYGSLSTKWLYLGNSNSQDLVYFTCSAAALNTNMNYCLFFEPHTLLAVINKRLPELSGHLINRPQALSYVSRYKRYKQKYRANKLKIKRSDLNVRLKNILIKENYSVLFAIQSHRLTCLSIQAHRRRRKHKLDECVKIGKELQKQSEQLSLDRISRHHIEQMLNHIISSNQLAHALTLLQESSSDVIRLQASLVKVFTALEAFAEYVRQNYPKGKLPVFNEEAKSTFRKIMKLFRSQISKFFAEDTPEYKHIDMKLGDIPKPTNTESLKKIFELYNITLSVQEETIIDYRNDYLHGRDKPSKPYEDDEVVFSSEAYAVDEDQSLDKLDEKSFYDFCHMHRMLSVLFLKIAQFEGIVCFYDEIFKNRSHRESLKNLLPFFIHI